MDQEHLEKRPIHLDLKSEEFRKIGHELIDKLSDYLESLDTRKVTTGESPSQIRSHFSNVEMPDHGEDPASIVKEAYQLMEKHSLHIGHPKFWGFICGSGLPINWLADLLVSAVNPNLGGYVLSPMGTEIEKQTIAWLGALIGCPQHSAGILVSGGNMANMVGFWAARKAKAPFNIQKKGATNTMISYVSGETHTWIYKAADLTGLGTDSIRWIKPDEQGKMPLDILAKAIKDDLEKGLHPFLVVANAGSVSTGAIDPILEIDKICKKHNIWLHIDGAYGGVAACIPGISQDLNAIDRADSIAIDPHKWLYSSLEAGCVLVKDQRYLENAFSYKPAYYKFEEHEGDSPTNFYQLGLQNSRSFRALKVWMALKQAGRLGYISNLQFDIELCKSFFKLLDDYPNLEAKSQNLSICTFRYIAEQYKNRSTLHTDEINSFNENLLLKIQEGGEAFLSNAVINGVFYLRICIVNHRTTLKHIRSLPAIVLQAAKELESVAKEE
jgi:glutamate/tyrosine decarboxylase-like PLP-dependent enzyme